MGSSRFGSGNASRVAPLTVYLTSERTLTAGLVQGRRMALGGRIIGTRHADAGPGGMSRQERTDHVPVDRLQLGVEPCLVMSPAEFSSLCSMTPQRRVRAARIAIAIAIVVGVVAAIIGNWFVVVTMGLAVLGQVVSLRANRQRLGGRRGG